MPRSGSSLIEQILGSHSEISAGGEMTWMSKLINRAHPDFGYQHFPVDVACLTQEAGKCFADEYLRSVSRELKGVGSIISNGKDADKICAAGNPGMASGGMGDILTGIIAGLIAQKIPLEMAAACGVCLHAEAAHTHLQQAAGTCEQACASDIFLLTFYRNFTILYRICRDMSTPISGWSPLLATFLALYATILISLVLPSWV